jgi:hypothetical protein
LLQVAALRRQRLRVLLVVAVLAVLFITVLKPQKLQTEEQFQLLREPLIQ